MSNIPLEYNSNSKIEELIQTASKILRKSDITNEDKKELKEIASAIDSMADNGKKTVTKEKLIDNLGIKLPAKRLTSISKLINNFMFLKEHGIQDFSKLKTRYCYAMHADLSKVEEKLGSIGFKDPAKLIKKYPIIAGLNIDKKIENFKNAGFSNPIKIIESYPPIISIDIKRAISDLTEVGFNNPVRCIEKYPPLASLSKKYCAEKIDYLKKYGISIEDIKEKPYILGYSLKPKMYSTLEYIRAKIGSYNIKDYGINIASVLYARGPELIKILRCHGINADLEEFRRFSDELAVSDLRR
ncbi:MAG: hypothetical protein ACP5RP_03235 [Candidatus Micrarchaeia archaeon]